MKWISVLLLVGCGSAPMPEPPTAPSDPIPEPAPLPIAQVEPSPVEDAAAPIPAPMPITVPTMAPTATQPPPPQDPPEASAPVYVGECVSNAGASSPCGYPGGIGFVVGSASCQSVGGCPSGASCWLLNQSGGLAVNGMGTCR